MEDDLNLIFFKEDDLNFLINGRRPKQNCNQKQLKSKTIIVLKMEDNLIFLKLDDDLKILKAEDNIKK
jgi:hypothetical protein